MFTQQAEKFFADICETLGLNGGLNNIIFLFLFLVIFVTVDLFCSF